MNGIPKYRIVAWSLAAVFALFNIGIPVVIASCPMAAMMESGACGMCLDDPSSSKVTTERTTSCCVTKIVADRNMNEFVQVQSKPLDSATLQSFLPSLLSVVNGLSSVFTLSHVSPSPPTVVDIPILTSSLLI